MNGLSGVYEKCVAAATSAPGWCTANKAATLAGIIVGLRPQLVVEIGIWGGSSFLPMALALKEVGSGHIVGIEPWSVDEAVKAQTENASRDWWAEQPVTMIRDGFFQRLREMNLMDICQIIEKPSRQVQVPVGIGVLHIDGAHNDEAITDVVRFAPQVEIGGYCVMDDENWSGGGVARASQRLTQMGFKRLYPLETGAVYQRIK